MAENLTKEYFDEQFEKLTRAVARGFEETATSSEVKLIESRLSGVEVQMLKANNRIKNLDDKVDRLLYSEIDRVEKRVDKIENHLGLKTA